MTKKAPRKQVIPIITGVNGKPVKRERKILALHYHPKGIIQALTDLKDSAEEQSIKDLFTDVLVLTSWALDRLPLVPPPTKEGESPKESSQNPTSE